MANQLSKYSYKFHVLYTYRTSEAGFNSKLGAKIVGGDSFPFLANNINRKKLATVETMILLIAVCGAVEFNANAQPRTYKIDMSTERIQQEERRGASIQTSGTVLSNSGRNNMELQTHQPLRFIDVHQLQGFRADGQDTGIPSLEEFIRQSSSSDYKFD